MPPIRYTITMQVLESAKDAGASEYVAACRACLNAWRIGRKAPEAFKMVMEAYEALLD